MSDEGLYTRIIHACARDGVKIKYDKNDSALAAKIEKFKIESQKREIFHNNPANYGVSLRFVWSSKYGFIYSLNCFGMFSFAESTVEENNRTFDEIIAATRKQAEVIRKARHHLACLIRLKNKLKLPGPVQKKISSVKGEKGEGTYLLKLSQEEIDEILKY